MLVKLHNVAIEGNFICDLNALQLEFINKFSPSINETVQVYDFYGPKEVKARADWNSKCKIYTESSEDEKQAIKEDLRKAYPQYETLTVQLNDKQLLELIQLKITHTYISTSEITVEASVIDITDRLQELTEKFLYGLSKANDLAFNAKCQVPKIDSALLMINEVKVEYDLCTDALQRELNNGWRILSVCPQPDQRRPDYVLGRYEKQQQ